MLYQFMPKDFKTMRPVFSVVLVLLQLSAFGQGFFLDDHVGKTASIPPYTESSKSVEPVTTTIVADYNNIVGPVSKYIYGNNANVYMTQMVTEPVLLNHISNLSPNVIRFPGGNLSSVFFWNAEPGQKPPDAPLKILDANGSEIDPGYWYGKNNESWTLSVDNYYEMLEQTGSTGIITINYGYARYGTGENPVASAAHLAADWVRYDNGRTKFWEIGNESNGSWQAGYRIDTSNNQDAQPAIVTGALYGNHFEVFADSMRKAAEEIGATIHIGAQLLQEAPASWWNSTDKLWNTGVFTEAANIPDYYIIHSYYTPYAQNSSVSTILNSATEVTETMMEYVTGEITKAGLTMKPIALTEWNIFAEGSKQQVSYINGMHAAIVLGELIKNRYGMASRWDLANGWGNGNDHGIFSQGDQPNIPKWTPWPAFFYMYYFQKYFGESMVSATVSGSSDVLAYASDFSSGESGIVVVNKGSAKQIVSLNLKNKGTGERYYYYTLTGGTDNGDFSLKVFVNEKGPAISAGGPSDYETLSARSSPVAGQIKISSPARSVTYILVDQGDDFVTGLEPGASPGFTIYPNPAPNKFTIHVSSPGTTKVEIFDTKGRAVFIKTINQQDTLIEVEPLLNPGIYFTRLSGTTLLGVQKLIIK
jgi:hypothetical protein